MALQTAFTQWGSTSPVKVYLSVHGSLRLRCSALSTHSPAGRDSSRRPNHTLGFELKAQTFQRDDAFGRFEGGRHIGRAVIDRDAGETQGVVSGLQFRGGGVSDGNALQ